MRLSPMIGLAALMLLSACHARPFQPPPSEVDMWQKPGGNKDDVRHAMTACGYPDYSGNDGHATLEQKAQRFECMKHSGLARTDGEDFCASMRSEHLKACEPQN